MPQLNYVSGNTDVNITWSLEYHLLNKKKKITIARHLCSLSWGEAGDLQAFLCVCVGDFKR